MHIDQSQPVCSIPTHAVFLLDHVNSEAGTCTVHTAAPSPEKSFAQGCIASQVDEIASLCLRKCAYTLNKAFVGPKSIMWQFSLGPDILED